MIKDESFVLIQGRMLTELWLHWNELFVYAIINSFTNQSDDHYFHWSLQYLAERTNSTKRNVQRNLQSLIDKWFIEKKEVYQNNIKFCEYRCVPIVTGIDKMSSGYGQNVMGGIDKMSTNNIIDNKEYNKENNIMLKNNKNIMLKENIMEEKKEKNSAKKEKKEIALKKDFSEYQFVKEFIDPENPSIAYQMKKNENYLLQQYSEIDKLNKDWFDNAIIQVVLNYIKQDKFRSENILSISKLRKKDKDGVPYIVRMIEKIKNYKPVVVDFDALHK